MDELKARIKQHEGFVNKIYKDSLGKATIGYGHLVLEGEQWEDGKEYSEEELSDVFENDFKNASDLAMNLIGDIALKQTAKEIIIEMCFQLGKPRVMKFKKMWEALRNNDFEEAANQMIDSAWHKQTTSRCESLASTMRGSNK